MGGEEFTRWEGGRWPVRYQGGGVDLHTEANHSERIAETAEPERSETAEPGSFMKMQTCLTSIACAVADFFQCVGESTQLGRGGWPYSAWIIFLTLLPTKCFD